MRPYAADLEPFRVPAYRRYLVAATITSLSLWIYSTSLTWTVLDASGSAAAVGLINTLMTLPLPFAAVPGGMLTDRLGPRNLIALALVGEAVCVGITGLLAAIGALSVPLALLLVLLFGIADGMYVVPSQVLVGRIVPPAAMASAIGTSMLTIGLGRILGGTVGGAAVAAFGPSAAMVPATVGVIAAAFTVLTLPRLRGTGGGARLSRSDLADGVAWLRATPVASAVIALGAVAGLFLWPYLGLLAVVVRDLVAGGAGDLGLLTAAGGMGAIIAAVTMGVIGRGVGRGRQLVAVLVVAGLAMTLLGISRSMPLTVLAVTLLAVMTVTHGATSNVVIQALAPAAMRGRALALHGLVFFGCMPVGFLIAGLLADRFGVGTVLVSLGLAAAGGSIAVALLDRRLLSIDIDDPGVLGAPTVVDPETGAVTSGAVAPVGRADPRAGHPPGWSPSIQQHEDQP